MKTALLILILCAFALPARAADETPYTASKLESLIASLPSAGEVTRWGVLKRTPGGTRDPMETALATKMDGEDKRCKELYFQLKTGKSVFDYPGLLVLGTVTWNPKLRNYTLRVEVPGNEEGDFAGFTCTFSESGIITKTRAEVWQS